MKYTLSALVAVLLTLYVHATSSETSYSNQYLLGDTMFQVTAEIQNNHKIIVWVSVAGDSRSGCSDTLNFSDLNGMAFSTKFTAILNTKFPKSTLPVTMSFMANQVYSDITVYFAKLLEIDRMPSGTLSVKNLIFPRPLSCNSYGFECEDCDKKKPAYIKIMQKEYILYAWLYLNLLENNCDSLPPYKIEAKDSFTTIKLINVRRSRQRIKLATLRLERDSTIKELIYEIVRSKEFETQKIKLLKVYNALYKNQSAIYLNNYSSDEAINQCLEIILNDNIESILNELSENANVNTATSKIDMNEMENCMGGLLNNPQSTPAINDTVIKIFKIKIDTIPATIIRLIDTALSYSKIDSSKYKLKTETTLIAIKKLCVIALEDTSIKTQLLKSKIDSLFITVINIANSDSNSYRATLDSLLKKIKEISSNIKVPAQDTLYIIKKPSPTNKSKPYTVKYKRKTILKYYFRNLSLLEEIAWILIDRVQRKKEYTNYDLSELDNSLRSVSKNDYHKKVRKQFYRYNSLKMFIDGLIDLDSTLSNKREAAIYKEKSLTIIDKHLQKISEDSTAFLSRIAVLTHEIKRDSVLIQSFLNKDYISPLTSQCAACKSDTNCSIIQFNKLVQQLGNLALIMNPENPDILYEELFTETQNGYYAFQLDLVDTPCYNVLIKVFDKYETIVQYIYNKQKKYAEIDSIKRVIEITTKDKIKTQEEKNKLQQTTTDDVRNFLIIDSVQFEFDQGTIKNIFVDGRYNNKSTELINRSPIPFSTLYDKTRFSSLLLFDPENQQYVVPISSLLKYVPRLVNNSEDYSPGDTTVTFRSNDPAKVLLKKSIREILRAKVYTDFMGTVEGNPNGLVQIEVGHKFNLWSRHFKYIKPKPCCPGNTKDGTPGYVGYFNYYLPTLAWTKIEQKDRSLEVLTTDTLVYNDRNSTVLHKDSTLGATQKNHQYVSTLDILRYSYFNIKPLNFNIISYYSPSAKMALHWDVGASWYITALKDTQLQKIDSFYFLNARKYNVNSTSINSELIWSYKPHPSINFSFSFNFMWFRMWDKRFGQAADPDGYKIFLSERKNRGEWLFNPSLTVSVFPMPKKIDGDIYFRFAYYSLLPGPPEEGGPGRGQYRQNLGENFMQAQVGLAVRLMK